MSNSNRRTLLLSLSALGIVYGDLGTSPLYALQQVLLSLDINPENVYGVLSLVFWSLILVISTCYVSVFLRADNDGEGGVLALVALLKRKNPHLSRGFFLMGIVGAGLLIGDGMITPAISVLSAIEGLRVISPEFAHYIMPVTVLILGALFISQRFGTTKISFIFGPILFCWFLIIAILGGVAIAHNPSILYAINPYYAFIFLYHDGWHAYLLLGSIFLVITGAEAMYADLGHFGKNPIRIGWFSVALPALLLNYFGQGANVLSHPDAMSNLFYSLAPSWFSYPLLILATMATIVASQSIISASFSLARQAILLDVCPRLSIIHTSKNETGQVYIPQVNMLLAFGTLLLVLIFQSSNKLAGAYGMAVNLVMLIVITLVICVARQQWKWSYFKIALIFMPTFIIDCLFLGANMPKIFEGAWIPLVVAFLISVLMTSWQKGMKLLRVSFYKKKRPLSEIINQLDHTKFNYVKDLTMIFLTDPYDNSGGVFYNYVKLNHVIPKHVLIVSVVVEGLPYIAEKSRYELHQLADGYYNLTLHYGFMQTIHIPRTLEHAEKNRIFPFALDLATATYLVEVINVSSVNKGHSRLFNWQKKLFSFLLHNSARDVDFFHLPHDKTISIGNYL